MSNDLLTDKEKKLLERLLEIETEASNSINKVDDKVIVSKFLKAYEEIINNDNK